MTITIQISESYLSSHAVGKAAAVTEILDSLGACLTQTSNDMNADLEDGNTDLGQAMGLPEGDFPITPGTVYIRRDAGHAANILFNVAKRQREAQRFAACIDEDDADGRAAAQERLWAVGC